MPIDVTMIRALERRCSIEQLHGVLGKWAWIRATLNTAFKSPRLKVAVPPELEVEWTRARTREARFRGYMNQALRCFQDRLGEARWQARCRIAGREQIDAARSSGQPVILAFSHFGPYPVLRSWLRAGGVPAAVLVGADSARRSRRERTLDQWLARADQPTVIYIDELRRATRFLEGGIPLLLAIEGSAGKQLDVTWGNGWSFQMGTGAIRLAMRHRARLVPCSIIEEGDWRFHIELGRPAPQDLVQSDRDMRPAATHLLHEFRSWWTRHPGQCGPDLFSCFRRTA